MKLVFTIINTVLVVLTAYLCAGLMYRVILPENFDLPAIDPAQGLFQDSGSREIVPVLDRQHPVKIVSRNLFKVLIEKKQEGQKESESVDPQDLELTRLKLVLWGTVTGGNQVYAVIEDKKQRQQALYEVGETVQGAKVKKILRRSVVLNYQGKDQRLEMETEKKNVRSGSKKSKINRPKALKPKAALAPPPEEPGSEDIASLMKQVKMRPHFYQGEPDGLMVYGIRPNSVFRQIGLRNGDIIKDINGTTIVAVEDAMNLYTEVSEADSAKITLLRRGREKEIMYHVKNGQYVIGTLSEHDAQNTGDE